MNESDDYLWDRSGSPDPDVARLEQLLSPLRHDAPLDELALRRKRRRMPWIVVGSVVAAAVAVALVWWRWPASVEREARPQLVACSGAAGFAFRALGGVVACGGAAASDGVLPVGGVLDTGAHEAELAIANIGTARLGAATRVRLDHTSSARHQLYLERGSMHAKVNAPPRIFAVATPGASVVDLGCEYTLTVDERGAGSIEVRTGKVELEGGPASGPGAAKSIVVLPAGTRARLLPGRRAGVPLLDDASGPLVDAAHAFEDGEQSGIARVLLAARAEDALSVVSLALLAPVGERRTILEALAALSPPPTGVTVESALANSAHLAAWQSQIVDLLEARESMKLY